MRRLGSVGALVAALALSAAAPAGAADAARLAGTTTIAADAAGYVPVQLEAPLTVVLSSENGEEKEATAQVDGGGRLSGFLLRLDDPGTDAPGIMRVDTPAFDLPRISPVGDVHVEPGETRFAITLPAGRYRLFAISAGEPVSVALRLPALAGEVKVRPTVAIPVVAEDLARRDPFPTGNLAIFGTSHPLTSTGLVALELVSSSLAGAAEQVELCVYPPGADATAPDAFGPRCPGGQATSDLPAVGFAGYGLGTTFVAERGDWGLGGNIEAASAPAEASGFGAWLSFDGTPIPGATIPDPPGMPSPPPPAAPAAPPPTPPAPPPSSVHTGGASAEVPPRAKRRKKAKRCPRVTRRSSRAAKRRAARCRKARRRAAARRPR